jgi:16S rRNA (uracil1498-N3)-methyltransferase
MRRRFLADEVRGEVAYLTGQNAAHLTRALRAKVGQVFEIAAEGVARLGKIVNISDNRVEFALGEEIRVAERMQLKLLVSIFKFDRMEWAIEKATELGATEIVPVVARRTDAHLAQAASKRAERWRRIAHEASQQSRRISPPVIGNPVKLKDALTIEANVKVVLAESETVRMLRDVTIGARAGNHASQSVALAFGPEGGWTFDELSVFEQAGWQAASLGPTILRAETAVVAAVAVIQAIC